MKKFITFASFLALLTSCGGSSDKGELVGVKGKKWHPEKPFGMTLIPGGAYIMGKSDDDPANIQDAPTKTVTVRSFYMDETEITNSEYRQFVEWVKDSTIRVRLAILADEVGQTSTAKGGKGGGKGGSIGDFAYSYNEPMHNDYFWHQAYGEYPVVGVNWKQAKAFCAWRTLNKNSYIKSKKKHQDLVNSFRLPIESEWEYAARGGLESGTFPWGGPYAKNDRGCFLANFKPNRGDYAADQALYTVEAKSYQPNGYNLYNMAGNVAEWTDTSYDAAAYEYVSSINPNVSDLKNMRKAVRGGSWKDVAYFLQVGTRDFEYADSARSYIGFRTVQDYMGTKVTKNGAPRK